MSSSDTPCSWKRTATRICSYLTYIFLLMDTAINNMRNCSSLKKKIKNNFRETLAGYNRNSQIGSDKGFCTLARAYKYRRTKNSLKWIYTRRSTRVPTFKSTCRRTEALTNKKSHTPTYTFVYTFPFVLNICVDIKKTPASYECHNPNIVIGRRSSHIYKLIEK